MVLMTVIDGEQRVYRDVDRRLYLNYINGFLLMRNYCKYGELYQLKGTERVLLRRFGVVKVT